MAVHSTGGESLFRTMWIHNQHKRQHTHTHNKLGIQILTSHKYKQQLCQSVNTCNTSVNEIIADDELTVPACPHPPGSCPPLSHPPLPRFPCTRCLLERGSESRAARLSYSIARHGGGPTTRLDFLSPFFLELWGYSGRTRLLHQVIKGKPKSVSSHVCSVSFFLARTKSPV